MRSRAKLARTLLKALPEARQVNRDRRGWTEIVDFTCTFADGFFYLLQERSEVVALLSEVEHIKPQRVLEIGTASGGTFFLISRASAPDAYLISLDLPAGRWGGGYKSWRAHVYRHVLLPRQRADFVRANSHAPDSLDRVKRLLRGEPLDFLFIDGDHSYQGVRQDFEMYSPLVRKGGLIGLHDIAAHPPESGAEVDRFWNEVKHDYRHREIITDAKQGWAGIGLLFP